MRCTPRASSGPNHLGLCALQVVNSLFEAAPTLGNVILLLVMFWMVFGILGINLFKGKFYYCTDGGVYGKVVLPFLDASLPSHSLSSAFSLPFLGASLPSHSLSSAFSLPFLGASLPSHCLLTARWTALGLGSSRRTASRS